MRNFWTKYKKATLFIGTCLAIIIGSSLFLLYGPILYFRETIITTAMTTMDHKYLASWFYSEKTISDVLNKHKVIENESREITTDKSSLEKYEKEILTKDKGNDLYKVIKVSGLGFRGYLVAVYDPSKVKIATSKYLGEKGELITTIAKNNNAVIAINGGGFFDPNWSSDGAVPHGTVIKNGKIVSDEIDASVGGGFIGFTYKNELVLSKMSKEEAIDFGYRDAVEFGPFLIVNGKSSFIKGNGGWGIAPRTVVGQRKDGIVLFLIIDGRIVSSIGADMLDLTKIMERYGAYNAANLDGGSSTELLIKGKIVNNPVGNEKDGLRKMPTFFIVNE